MKKKILFYSSVKDKNLFKIQRFYYTDIEILENLGYIVYATNNIFDFLKFWKYNISFLYFYKYSMFPALISRLFFKKVYFTGGIDSLERSICSSKVFIIQKYLFKVCRVISTSCIIVSNSDLINIKKIYNNKLPSKLYFSNHTIDVSTYQLDYYNKDNNFCTICWMGSIDNVIRKGVDLAIKVYSELIKIDKFKFSKLYIIGKIGDGTNYLQSICDELNLTDNIIFTDNLSEYDKVNIVKRNKYYFQFSKYEGFGIAALEALAAKNIVLHSGRGGLNETISDFGILINIDDEIGDIVNDIICKIDSYDMSKMDLLNDYISNKYSNYLRENKFKELL